MKLQLLVSTMHQKDKSLLEKMNIQSDAIIINQCETNEVKELKYKKFDIKFMSFSERGVGLSRNNALMRMVGDIGLMADDDMVYRDGYPKTVIETFKENPKADIIMFNVPIHMKKGEIIEKIKKKGKVRLFNSLKFGTVNIAFKKESIIKHNIFFSLLFGGGARYGSGEDSLFIIEALKKGLKIYSSTDAIADIKENHSTWFTGYNENYFFDRGALFQAIARNKMSYLLMIQFLIRKKKLYQSKISMADAFTQMVKGRKDFLNRESKKL